MQSELKDSFDEKRWIKVNYTRLLVLANAGMWFLAGYLVANL